MCGYALARWGGFILPYTAAVVVTPSPRCNAGVCFVTKCEYVPCSLTICRSLEFLCSKHIVIEASVFHAVIHIQAFLSTFFSTTYPIPYVPPGERLERLFLLLCLSDAAASKKKTA